MKNKLKRFVALTMAMLFMWSVLPVTLNANPQNPVDNFWLVHQTPLSSQNYTFMLRWVRPPASSAPMGIPGGFLGSPHNPGGVELPPPPASATVIDAWNQHRATNYRVMRRNAALADTPGNWIGIGDVGPITISEPSFHYVNNNLATGQRMQNGRIYAFRIDARHYHTVWNPTLLITQNHAVEAIGTSQVHFLTDLNVSASGVGNQMTVTWSRPLLDGVDPFTSYRIFFAPGGSTVTNIFAHDFIDIATTSPNLTIVGNTYTYTFTTAPGVLVPGAVYAVAVEPRLGNATRRTVSPSLADAFMDTRGITLHYTMNEYRTNTAFVRPIFQYTPVGLDLLQLSWGDIVAGASEVVLSMRPHNVDARIILGRITGAFNIDLINYWLTQRPNVITYFYLDIIRGGGYDETLVIRFDPSITAFSPTRPNILHIDHDPKPAVQPITLDIMWQAFHRTPYTQMELADIANIFGTGANTIYFDPNIVFEVFISDNLDTLATLSAVNNQAVEVLSPEDLARIAPGTTAHNPSNWAHEYSFTHFWCSETNQFRLIEANRVYYVRINTRRTVSTMQVSWPAYGAHFIPGEVDLRPLTVPAPPLRVYDESLNSITIAWEQSWLEVFDPGSITTATTPGTYQWHTRVALRGGTLVFGDNIQAGDAIIDLLDIAGAMATINASGSPAPMRIQTLEPHLRYEIHWRRFVDISDAITPPPDDAFEIFVENLHNNPGAWTSIGAPVPDGTTMRHTITGLDPNTTYAIFFRPYNPRLTNQHERNAWWPTMLMGTTTDQREDVEVVPTVPILRPHSEGDIWLRFGLRPYSNPPLRYEFRISEFPEFSTAWEFEATREDMFNADGFEWRRFAATQLFPETTYYIWARAVGVALDGSNLYSLWSNPIAMRTTPIVPPNPPRGLGIASQNDVHIINLDNDRDLRPVEPNAMIITWLPHPGDDNLPIEMQDGAMGTEIMGSPSILHAYLVRFPGLAANRPFYVRARTIYSIHREGVGQPVSDVRFNYIVQMATNPHFLDATTVFVLPDSYQIRHDTNTRMAMSDWTQTFIFHTARDDGEYDGDVIEELFPLPMHDFEIIYTAATQTLLFRFRSTGVDADGHQDNLVDQRFISRLIQQRVFDHHIDMTHYNHLPVRNRIVELPYSIITAFEERQISFSITAGDTRYSLSPGFAATPQNAGFNVNSRLRIYINDLTAAEVPALPDGQNYVIAPQNVSINVRTTGGHTNDAINLTTLAAPLNVAQSINQAAMLDANIGGFTKTADDVNWRRLPSTFNEVTGTLNFATNRPADFAAIATGIPVQVGLVSPAVRDALYFVNSQLAFEDMDWFMEDNPINAWQINRIISAIATGADSVAINIDLTPAQVSSLSNAGMLVPGGETVTREAAISALVRLHEVRTRSRVTGYPTLAASAFPDMGTTTAARQQAMLRAEFLGFLDPLGQTTANPHGHLTMGDAMMIFEIILRN